MRKSLYRDADRKDTERVRRRPPGQGDLPGIRHLRCHLLELEVKIA